MEYGKREGVPLDGFGPGIKGCQNGTVEHVDKHEMAVGRTRITAIGYHSHHYVVVLLITDR